MFLRALARVPARPFHFSPVARQGSLFGEVTQQTPVAPVKADVDERLEAFRLNEAKQRQMLREKYVLELKRRLFDASVAQNGFFKNHQVVMDPETQRLYKVSLTSEEIDILEPTIYILLYRIKLLMKKATLVNRFVRGANVKSAINQLHFNPKKMATEVEKVLKRGLEQAREQGYDEELLYIQALWTGLDGGWVKRAKVMGRGRTGIMEHPYIHVKAILKTAVTSRRVAWEKQEQQRLARPAVPLNTEPLNFSVRAHYRW